MDSGDPEGNKVHLHGDSWIPVTPAKPILPKPPQPPAIYAETHRNQPQSNLFNFPAEAETSGGVACHSGANWMGEGPSNSYNWEAGSAGQFQAACSNNTAVQRHSVDGANKRHIPFLQLLALADAATLPDAATLEAADAALRGNAGGLFDSGSCISEAAGDELCDAYQHAYDLNFPSGTESDAASIRFTSQFAPVTPDKSRIGKTKVLPELQNLPTENSRDANELNHNCSASTTLDGENLRENQEVHEPAAAASSVTATGNPDEKGGNGSINPSKTPTPRQRRKKHRPKVIVEGKSKRTTPNSKSPSSNSGKRKYVRKKGLNEPATTPSIEVTGESTDQEVIKRRRKPCRRTLHFDPQTQTRDESSLCRSFTSEPMDQNSQNIQSMTGVVEVGLGQVDYSINPNGSANQMLKGCKSLPDKQAPSAEIAATRKSPESRLPSDHQMEHNATQNGVSSPLIQGSSNGFIFCANSMLTDREEEPCCKRTRSHAIKQADTNRMNLTGVHYNSLYAYQSVSWVHFPNIYKKKRSEKGQNSTTSTGVTAARNFTRPENTCFFNNLNRNCMMSRSNSWIAGSQINTYKSKIASMHGGKELPDKLQKHRSIMALGQTERSTKKRSRATKRICNSAPSAEIANFDRSQIGINTQFEKMHATIAKKKRTKRKSLQNSAVCNTNVVPWLNRFATSNHYQCFHETLGTASQRHDNQMCCINAIVEQLKHLDINKENDNLVNIGQALIPYNMQDQEHNALVVYRRDGTIVPFNPVKKRHPRPKVELDEETNRVWKLLLENINSEGIDGTDEEKTRWWEEERRVFRGRVDSFIARMHLVQGDRRFSPWKGSVVDSVVGVFLTQNVSDHLSSSAFMSLAARFPPKPKHQQACCQEASLELDDPKAEDHMPFEKPMMNQQISEQSSLVEHEDGKSDGQYIIDNNESSGSNTEGRSSNTEPESKKISSSQNILECRDSVEEISLIGTRTSQTFCSKKTYELYSIHDCLDSSISQTNESMEACLEGNSEDLPSLSKEAHLGSSSAELIQMAGLNALNEVQISGSCQNREGHFQIERSTLTEESGSQVNAEIEIGVDISKAPLSSSELSINVKEHSSTLQSQGSEIEDPYIVESQAECADIVHESLPDSSSNAAGIATNSNPTESDHSLSEEFKEKTTVTSKAQKKRVGKEKESKFDWDNLRKQAAASGMTRQRTENTMDSLDWEAVRCTDVDKIAHVIRERGMNNMLAERIKDFLNRLVKDHGSIDLEWLRDVAPDQAKEYLLSIRGLGLKSVECVRLLTLHHLAFPVDTNVGRIAVRLGWVHLQPLPESLQLHLLELYPVLESIQKYLWPRLCKLDQRTLYELHYQMITFGKVFCTKSKPNCNACPMRGECRHFASAFASARLSLPAPEDKRIVGFTESREHENPARSTDRQLLPLPPSTKGSEPSELSNQSDENIGTAACVPIIEEPATPEQESTQLINDIEDAFYEDPDEIPTIKLNIEEFSQNLQNYMQKNMELQEGDMSKALIALTPEAAAIPMPKLKNISRLRTEHQVYELPDFHPLLEKLKLDRREPDDPCFYLLAIWTPGETASSIQPPEKRCSYQECGQLCNEKECFSCNSVREANSQMVRGTLLIPCRTAMRGSFPLNGTYFQVNEVFADHDSSLNPIEVPRSWIWNLHRRTVYFGTSIPTIFKGLSTEGIQHCFWRGFVCVRGFDKKSRAPRPLMARLHFPASKLNRGRGKTEDQ